MRKVQSAFTLIELLTVIAIIAILAGIIVPVYGKVKDGANRSSDISNMNALRTALGLYREDQGAYPPQLLGYVTLYSSGPNAGNVIPATEIKNFLYPTRVQSIDTLRPIRLQVGTAAVVSAVFPSADASAVGSTPLLDLDGDGDIDGNDDPAGARQAYGPGDGNVCWNSALNAVVGGSACGATPALQFYRISGYDVSRVPVPGGGERDELRYARFWTGYSIGVGPGLGAGSQFDDPRQLGYTNPPDDTIVTWNSFYREYPTAGNPQAIRRDITLQLSGSARPWDSKQMADWAWRQRPN
ncbi:prepilin-type N-terminal cleavage/methylation domain-containing protein [Kamptonema cortianum]|nr:prepilin-type N-terminal cleavage/methylation domain-containing protein [Geitlerinema splendidum]MDK3156938.1 prepilin-type N-terminal cleavage/methylation domain-containing protein [Kamptonema cortianum]